jgi:hypothetical protein
MLGGIECSDGMIDGICFSCLNNKYNIDQKQLLTIVDNYRIYSYDYPLHIQFTSEEDTNIVCDFINKHIILKILSRGFDL